MSQEKQSAGSNQEDGELVRELQELRELVATQQHAIEQLMSEKAKDENIGQLERERAEQFVRNAERKNNNGKYGWEVTWEFMARPVVMLMNSNDRQTAIGECTRRFGSFNAREMDIRQMEPEEVKQYKAGREEGVAA